MTLNNLRAFFVFFLLAAFSTQMAAAQDASGGVSPAEQNGAAIGTLSELLNQYGNGKLDAARDANGNINPEILLEIGRLASGIDLAQAGALGSTLSQYPPDQIFGSFPGLEHLTNVQTAQQNGQLDALLRDVYEGLDKLYKDPNIPQDQKGEIYNYLSGLHTNISNQKLFAEATKALDDFVKAQLESVGLSNFANSIKELMSGNIKDPADLAQRITKIDPEALQNMMKKLGTTIEGIEKYLPAGVTLGDMKDIFDAFQNGTLDQFVKTLSDKLADLISANPALSKAKEELESWIDRAFGKLGGFVKDLIGSAFKKALGNIGRIFKKPKFPLENLGNFLSALGTVALVPLTPEVAKLKAKEIGGLLMAVNIDEAEWELKALKDVNKDNLFEAFPKLNASEIAAIKMRLDDKTLIPFLDLVKQEQNRKFRLLSAGRIGRILRNMPMWHYTSNYLHHHIKAYLGDAKFGELIGGLDEVMKEYESGRLEGGVTDLEVLSAKIGEVDIAPLIEKIRKLGNPKLEELASYLPETVKLDQLEKVMNGFAEGTLAVAMETLQKELGKLIQKVLPDRLPKLQGLQDKVSGFTESLQEKLGDKVDGVLKGSGLGDLLGGLGKGGFTGMASHIPLDKLGLDKINIPGAGNLQDLIGKAASSSGGTLGDIMNSGAMESLGGIIGGLIGGGGLSLCPRKNSLTSFIPTSLGNTRKLDGRGDHDEIPDCPKVNCDQDIGLTGRVKDYFEYTPPKSNLKTLLDRKQHDYEVDFGRRYSADSTQRAPGYVMISPDGVTCKLRKNNNDVNEPCQDNRWRDSCMTGQAQKDLAFNSNKNNTLNKYEEPWPGVGGSMPPVDPENTETINCLIPKNTEHLSPLAMDNGWRYRYMCPGDNQLGRNPSDGFLQHTDLFYELDAKGKDYNCKRVISKCTLQKDWDIKGNNQWRDVAYGAYKKALLGNTGTLTLLWGMLSDDQQNAVKTLFKPESTAPECKPAFWVRLMADSCANQYISQTAHNPDLVYNPDQQYKAGLSPRFCQPLRTDVSDLPMRQVQDTKGKTVSIPEYNPTEYLQRAATAVLAKDYMPWLDRGNPWKGKDADKLYQDWQEKMEKDFPRKIGTSGKFSEAWVEKLYKQQQQLTTYASQPVERILDPTHPYSPRYDIALNRDGQKITDRTLFAKATETPMFMNPLLMISQDGAYKGMKCSQTKRKGYFEYGNCTTYCSAVNVDVLRFRYEDYRLCMGCQINGNEYAFWEEQRINRNYYFGKRCWAQFESSTEKPKEPEDNECTYGDDICGACTNAALTCAPCAVGACDAQQCAEDTFYCVQCGAYAGFEATERARERINHKQKPEYGPTKTKTDEKNWPICSTRYDYAGDAELCKKAKEASGKCKAQGEYAENDPNIGEKRVEAAASCVEKTIDDICHAAARPVAGLNFLKMRPVKEAFASADEDWNYIKNLDAKLKDKDPPKAYQFRTYFQNNRPYMRWWDTGKEAMQGLHESKPDYSCDVGANDTYFGVGRDFNSIHGRAAQICAYLGGDGIGDNCFKMQEWRDGLFPDLAGTEWSELKMYQMNCYRRNGLNCLCQYEKIFKPEASEDAPLNAFGTTLETFSKIGGRENKCFSSKKEPCHERVPRSVRKENGCPDVVKDQPDFNADGYLKFVHMAEDGQSAVVEVQVPCEHRLAMGWRGYASTPQNYDGRNAQFPYLYDKSNGAIVTGGLDQAKPGDILVWPAQKGTLPRVAWVVSADTEAMIDGGIKRSPKYKVNNNYGGEVVIREKNNGLLPDVCGNTTDLDRGDDRTLYPNIGSLPEEIRQRIEEQVSATYSCENPYLGSCVEPLWKEIVIFRPSLLE